MIDSPLVLLVVMALIAAIPLVLRRHRATQPDGLRVLSRTALSRSAVVAVVAVGERRLLVGAGDQGVHLIADVTGVEDLEAGTVGSLADRTTTMTVDDGDPFATIPVGTAAAGSAAGGTAHLSTLLLGRTDAVGTNAAGTARDDGALGALVAGASPATTAGPRIGLVDRLRAMTVRTPTQGRPFHVPLRR